MELARVPATTAELKAAIPTAWSPRLEQLLIRSMSFSEYEMISHPVILLTVVSTSDPDPVACMQELASYHHTPPCLSTVRIYISFPNVMLPELRNHDQSILCLRLISSLTWCVYPAWQGQYDPDVHRVYLLLHDPFSAPGIDPNSVLRRVSSQPLICLICVLSNCFAVIIFFWCLICVPCSYPFSVYFSKNKYNNNNNIMFFLNNVIS